MGSAGSGSVVPSFAKAAKLGQPLSRRRGHEALRMGQPPGSPASLQNLVKNLKLSLFVQLTDSLGNIKALITMTHQLVIASEVREQRRKAGVVRPESTVYDERFWAMGGVS
jgi:hypothetical protein